MMAVRGDDEQEFVVVDDTGIGCVRFVLPDGRRLPTLHVDLADPGSGEMIPLATVVMDGDDWHRTADLTEPGATSPLETGWIVTRASAGLAVPGTEIVSSA